MNKNITALCLFSLLPLLGFSNTATQISGVSDLVLLVLLCGIIILLVGVAYALVKSIEGVSQIPFPKKKQTASTKLKSVIVLILLSTQAQAETIQTPKVASYTMSNLEFWLLIGTIVSLFILIGILFRTLNALIKINKGESFQTESEKGLLESLNLTDFVPMEKEVEIMLNHDYDGIKELDNNLPPWWKYMFYATIVFAVVYLFRFHISGSGKLQHEEYAMEVEAAVAKKAEMMASAAENITEDNVVYLVDAPTLERGAAIYTGKCASCHGQLGEGGVGPNLTDDYWIHGGGIKNIFKSVKYGIPAKGMIAWQTQMSPSEMQKIASYVLSLKGSNPMNAKAPQGEIYVEKIETTEGDSTTVVIELEH